jgi:hypothetical protein
MTITLAGIHQAYAAATAGRGLFPTSWRVHQDTLDSVRNLLVEPDEDDDSPTAETLRQLRNAPSGKFLLLGIPLFVVPDDEDEGFDY